MLVLKLNSRVHPLHRARHGVTSSTQKLSLCFCILALMCKCEVQRSACTLAAPRRVGTKPGPPEWVARPGRTRRSERLAFALGAKSLEKRWARGPGACCLQKEGWWAGHAHCQPRAWPRGRKIGSHVIAADAKRGPQGEACAPVRSSQRGVEQGSGNQPGWTGSLWLVL